jgi:hypothetical protein
MPQLGERKSRLFDDADHRDLLDPSVNQKEACPHSACEPRLPHRSAQVASMDGRRVDALSRAFGESVTRKRFLALLPAGGASAIAAIWGRDLSAAKHSSRKKGTRRKESKKGTRRQQESQQSTTGCGGPTTYRGSCTTNADCSFSSIPGSICDAETRQCVQSTCKGSCQNHEMCSARAGDCVCLGLSEESSGMCGQCIQDALPANSRDECCSGDFCQFDKICGLCVPG